MKKIAVLLTILLIAMSFVVAGCGRAEANTDYLPRPVPHKVGVPFENCNVCHVGDQLSVTNISHADFTNGTCAQTGCHGERVYVRPNPNPSATSRAIPHIVTAPLDNCIACHIPAKTGNIIQHSMYVDNSMCLNAVCHRPMIAPPTTTTQPPATTSQTVAPPTSSPTDSGKVLNLPARALPTNANHSANTLAMCAMCHMGSEPVYPTAPSWKGSASTPGTWTVTAGSDADHTNRTDGAACVASGCHAKSW